MLKRSPIMKRPSRSAVRMTRTFFQPGRAYFANDNEEKAQEVIARALLINPDFTDGKAFIGYMKRKGKDKGSTPSS